MAFHLIPVPINHPTSLFFSIFIKTVVSFLPCLLGRRSCAHALIHGEGDMPTKKIVMRGCWIRVLYWPTGPKCLSPVVAKGLVGLYCVQRSKPSRCYLVLGLVTVSAGLYGALPQAVVRCDRRDSQKKKKATDEGRTNMALRSLSCGGRCPMIRASQWTFSVASRRPGPRLVSNFFCKI